MTHGIERWDCFESYVLQGNRWIRTVFFYVEGTWDKRGPEDWRFVDVPGKRKKTRFKGVFRGEIKGQSEFLLENGEVVYRGEEVCIR